MAVRTGYIFKDAKCHNVTSYNGGEQNLWVCPLCGGLCSARSFYTHVDYHEARGEKVFDESST